MISSFLLRFKFHYDSINLTARSRQGYDVCNLNSIMILLISLLAVTASAKISLFKFHYDSINFYRYPHE